MKTVMKMPLEEIVSTQLQIINHVPDAKYNYPATYMNGCNCRFKVEWVKAHPWLHYSPTEDGVYCKACALFAPDNAGRQKLGILVLNGPSNQLCFKVMSSTSTIKIPCLKCSASSKLVFIQPKVLLACSIRSAKNEYNVIPWSWRH